MKMSGITIKFSTDPQTLIKKVSAQVKTSCLLSYQAAKFLKLYLYRVGVVKESKPGYVIFCIIGEIQFIVLGTFTQSVACNLQGPMSYEHTCRPIVISHTH